MQESKVDTRERSDRENPAAWLHACASGEILWLGEEAVVFFRLGKQGLVLVQRNAWGRGPHELEWVSPALLKPFHTPAARDDGKAPSECGD